MLLRVYFVFVRFYKPSPHVHSESHSYIRTHSHTLTPLFPLQDNPMANGKKVYIKKYILFLYIYTFLLLKFPEYRIPKYICVILYSFGKFFLTQITVTGYYTPIDELRVMSIRIGCLLLLGEPDNSVWCSMAKAFIVSNHLQTLRFAIQRLVEFLFFCFVFATNASKGFLLNVSLSVLLYLFIRIYFLSFFNTEVGVSVGNDTHFKKHTIESLYYRVWN